MTAVKLSIVVGMIAFWFGGIVNCCCVWLFYGILYVMFKVLLLAYAV